MSLCIGDVSQMDPESSSADACVHECNYCSGCIDELALESMMLEAANYTSICKHLDSTNMKGNSSNIHTRPTVEAQAKYENEVKQ